MPNTYFLISLHKVSAVRVCVCVCWHVCVYVLYTNDCGHMWGPVAVALRIDLGTKAIAVRFGRTLRAQMRAARRRRRTRCFQMYDKYIGFRPSPRPAPHAG